MTSLPTPSARSRTERHRKWRVAVSVSGAKEAEVRPAYTLTTDFLISAVGQLNTPSIPALPGLDSFGGKVMHTARWDWTYDYTGKRVAVVGNGASGVQVVPAIAGGAREVRVFQRTPSYVTFRGDRRVAAPVRGLLGLCPPLLWTVRQLLMDFRELTHRFTMRLDGRDGFDLGKSVAASTLRSQLPRRPDLWDALTPQYTLGSKRVLLSDDYYPALERENVHLVTGAVERVTRDGVVAADGTEYPADLVVFATGFKTTDFLAGIEITGQHGTSLRALWGSTPRALYGTAVEGMPNFAVLYGPNTNLGHNSIILMIEAQMRYVLPLVREVLAARRAHMALAITPDPRRVAQYNAELQAAIARTALADERVHSWYKNADGVVVNNWPGTVVAYQRLLARVRWADYVYEGEGS
ncbi:hypothetical protein KEM52_003923 [Ascosphaera acerosa]|nr:hypothetical protein KEM52_003923 [Ascosphaera acerosa]